VELSPTAGDLLTAQLFGRMEVEAGCGPVRLPGRQAQALLALMLLDRRRRPREAIAADLWPDAGASSPGCLRQALWLVRSAIADAGVDPDTVVEADSDVLGIRAEARIGLDVPAFERAARGGSARPDTAIALYRGDLVEALGHECFVLERERLSDLYEDALAHAAQAHLDAGHIDAAQTAAERLLARDPLREEAHSVLIAVFGHVGTRSQVARQYRRLCGVLARELEVEPLPETRQVYRHALATTVARSARAVGLRPLALLPGVRRRGPALTRPALRAIAAGN
jgi:DNA-binding SARP family transcriptional activator